MFTLISIPSGVIVSRLYCILDACQTCSDTQFIVIYIYILFPPSKDLWLLYVARAYFNIRRTCLNTVSEYNQNTIFWMSADS
jgi:hypothetical protein